MPVRPKNGDEKNRKTTRITNARLHANVVMSKDKIERKRLQCSYCDSKGQPLNGHVLGLWIYG